MQRESNDHGKNDRPDARLRSESLGDPIHHRVEPAVDVAGELPGSSHQLRNDLLSLRRILPEDLLDLRRG